MAYSQTEKAALFGECKWSVKPVGSNVLEALKQKSQTVIKQYGLNRVQYALFSRIGFTAALEKQADNEDIKLFTVKSFLRASEEL